MTITQEPETDAPPAWLAPAIERRRQADEAARLTRAADNRQSANTINSKLRELGIEPVSYASITASGHLNNARLIRPYELGEEWGVTAGLHDGVVSVFVDNGDDNVSPALTRHVCVGPLNSRDDVLNAVYDGAPKRAPAPIDHEDAAKHHLRCAEQSEYGSNEELHHLAAAHAHAILGTITDRATVADLRYRLAAIERLIAHVASSSPDATAALVGSAIHEIARGARTPEDALTLLPPEWSTALSGLNR